MTRAASPTRTGDLQRTVRAQRSGLFWRWTAFRRSLAERPGGALTVVAFLLAGVVAVATGIRGFRGLAEAESLRQTLTEDVRILEAQSSELEDAIGTFRADSAALELRARIHHDLVEPGETVVLLRFPEPVGPPRREPASPEAP